MREARAVLISTDSPIQLCQAVDRVVDPPESLVYRAQEAASVVLVEAVEAVANRMEI